MHKDKTDLIGKSDYLLVLAVIVYEMVGREKRFEIGYGKNKNT